MGNDFKLNCQQYVFKYLKEDRYDGFDEGDYVFVDEYGLFHCFKELSEIDKSYYDTSGLGLTMYIKDEGQEIQIADNNKNILIFVKNQNESTTNRTIFYLTKWKNFINYQQETYISKTIQLDETGKPLSIYDNRKENRKIEFTYYENGLLATIRNNSTEGIIGLN